MYHTGGGTDHVGGALLSMRILFVTGLTHFGRAGVQRETERLIAALLDREVEVGFVVDTPIEDLPDATYFHMPFPPPADADRIIGDAIAKFRPNAMHVMGGGVRLMQAAQRAAERLPWVISVHNVPPAERTARWMQGRNALHYPLRNLLSLPSANVWRRFLRTGQFTRAVCHSAFIADVAQRAGCPGRKLVEIPLGCDDADLTQLEDLTGEACLFDEGDSPRLVSVGGMAHHKGFHDYLRVVERLVPDHPKLRYVVMGDVRDPHYLRTLERMVHRMNLQKHVKLMPKASEAQRLTTATRADLYVVPSHEEGFCLSYLEGAMLCRRALGTRCGAIAQIAEDDPAQRAVAPGDIDALEQATRQLLATNASTSALQQRREQLRQRYAWQAYFEAHHNLYRALTTEPVPVPVA